MDMHDMGSLGHTLQKDLQQNWANLALYRDKWRGWFRLQAALQLQVFALNHFAYAVGGHGFVFHVFVVGWRHAFWSEWPFISII